MDRIFIDANIWLDFYDGRFKDIHQLLETLQALAGHLILPKQIVFEVHRNRVNRYLNSVNGSEKQDSTFDLEFGKLPDVTEECIEWNERLKSLRTEFKDQKAALYQERLRIVSEHTEAVCTGGDNTSVSFERIFANAVEATDAQIELARLRKDSGNPPGKRKDPLGDQVCWEQILATLNDGDRIWVISRDGDYTVSNGENLHLDPLLMFELKAKFAEVPEVHCFTDLPKALKHYKANKADVGDFSIPSDEVLESIEEEYISAKGPPLGALSGFTWGGGAALGAFNRRPSLSSQLVHDYESPPLTSCPNCQASLLDVSWIAHPSPRGMTYQAGCPSCGAWVDSFETLG